jgi:hypothetical protein
MNLKPYYFYKAWVIWRKKKKGKCRSHFRVRAAELNYDVYNQAIIKPNNMLPLNKSIDLVV